MTRQEALDQMDLDYQAFREWLLANINRPDIVGPIPEGEQASPLRRRISRIVSAAETLYEGVFAAVEDAGPSAGPADFMRAANSLREELEISKRDILAALNTTASSTSGGSNLPMILAFGVGALVLYAISQK